MPFYPHLDGRIERMSTKEDIVRVLMHGGRIDVSINCPLCSEIVPHYHYICTECLQMDMENDDCWRCRLDRKKAALDAQISLFFQRNHCKMKRLGIVVVFVLFTIANWRVK